MTTLYSVTELREILGFEQIVVPEREVKNIIFWTYLNPDRVFLVASFKYQDRRVKKSILLHDGHHVSALPSTQVSFARGSLSITPYERLVHPQSFLRRTIRSCDIS